MSDAPANPPQFAVLCLAADPAVREALLRDLRAICGDCARVEAFQTIADLLQRLKSADHAGREVLAVCVAGGPQLAADEALRLIGAGVAWATPGTLLVGDDPDATALADGRVSLPWTLEQLSAALRPLATAHVLRYCPELMDRLGPLVDATTLSAAFVITERSRREISSQLQVVQQSILDSDDIDSAQVEQAMVDGLDQTLGHPQRRRLPAGTVLLEEGQSVESIWVLLEGRVRLSQRVGGRDIVFDPQSAGRIVGMLALAQRQHAFFTCTAATDVTVMPLTWEQLDLAFRRSPVLYVCFATVLVRSLANRIRHIASLTLEVEQLNAALSAERDHLAETLAQLEKTQMRLIASEKMATLGQLAAGVAHELNNPIAAIRRSADHVAEDVAALTASLPEADRIAKAMNSAMDTAPLSTMELRERRMALESALGDADLVRQLLRVGITTMQQYHAAVGGLDRQQRAQRLALLEHAHQLGVSLRNIRSGSERVAAIVRSLKSHARPGVQTPVMVNLVQELEDTLLLFGPQLRRVELVRQYQPVPQVECHAGQINQVWTNLISNALEAMESGGTLTVEVDAPDQRHVRVRLTDTGHGIPPEHLQRVFDLNFTTKRGQSAFGLGMGLAICRQIIERHSGRISIESSSKGTCVTVVLPVKYTPLPGEDPGSDHG